MLDAMAQAVTDRGYASMAVSDVIKRAGVSRETFYEHFTDKEDCFLQALDATSSHLVRALSSANTAEFTDPTERLDHLLGSYLETLAASPAHAKMVLVEAFAAGPRAAERRFAIQRRFVELTIKLSGARRAEERFACELLVAAISAMVTNRVATGHADELPKLRAPIVRAVRGGAFGWQPG